MRPRAFHIHQLVYVHARVRVSKRVQKKENEKKTNKERDRAREDICFQCVCVERVCMFLQIQTQHIGNTDSHRNQGGLHPLQSASVTCVSLCLCDIYRIYIYIYIYIYIVSMYVYVYVHVCIYNI